MAVSGYLIKLKRGQELTFGAYFLHGFSYKCSLFNTLSIDTVSTSYIFFTRYQTKCVKFLFRQLMTSYTLRFIFNHPVKQWPMGEGDERKSEIQKFEYVQNKKNFLVDEEKGIFHNNLRVIICWIKEK